MPVTSLNSTRGAKKEMSMLEIGPVVFGGNEKIIDYLRQKHLLSRIRNCAR